MAYATLSDVEARITRTLSTQEESAVTTMLDDAAVMIDAFAPDSASDEVKKVVSCRMVIRAIGDGENSGVPVGATQGSMSGLGYAQSWTIGGGGGAAGELYLSKIEKQMLGMGNMIGSHSPVEDLVASQTLPEGWT